MSESLIICTIVGTFIMFILLQNRVGLRTYHYKNNVNRGPCYAASSFNHERIMKFELKKKYVGL